MQYLYDREVHEYELKTVAKIILMNNVEIYGLLYLFYMWNYTSSKQRNVLKREYLAIKSVVISSYGYGPKKFRGEFLELYDKINKNKYNL